MFLRIKDTKTSSDRHHLARTMETRETIINVDAIEAITYVSYCTDKIKIHLSCEKEFKADILYLDKILELVQKKGGYYE